MPPVHKRTPLSPCLAASALTLLPSLRLSLFNSAASIGHSSTRVVPNMLLSRRTTLYERTEYSLVQPAYAAY